jgi:hypothetical protein
MGRLYPDRCLVDGAGLKCLCLLKVVVAMMFLLPPFRRNFSAKLDSATPKISLPL